MGISSQNYTAIDGSITCDVVKVGGCILTNKNGRYEVNQDNVEYIARILAKELPLLSVPLIFVVGGGSFGNLAPKEYGLESADANWESINLPMVALASFDLYTQVTQIFRKFGVPVFPFQTSAVTYLSNSGIRFNAAPVMQAMRLGAIPILCGDLVFNADKGFEIFSSDNIPVAISNEFNIRSVLYYTNVPGIYFPRNTQSIIKTVSAENFEAVLQAAGPSEQNDLTGGMKNKLIQIAKLAEKGIQSEIIDFTYFDSLIESLEKRKQFGTRILNFKERCF